MFDYRSVSSVQKSIIVVKTERFFFHRDAYDTVPRSSRSASRTSTKKGTYGVVWAFILLPVPKRPLNAWTVHDGTIPACWYCGARTMFYGTCFSLTGKLFLGCFCDYRLESRKMSYVFVLNISEHHHQHHRHPQNHHHHRHHHRHNHHIHMYVANAHQGSSFDSCPFCFSRNSSSASRTCLKPNNVSSREVRPVTDHRLDSRLKTFSPSVGS